MNDELTGQLAASGWRIPTALQSHLWLKTDHETVRVKGDVGLFTLTVPAKRLDILVGEGDNSTRLARLHWNADSLEWHGAIRLGGQVESLTVLQVGRQVVTAATVVGSLLKWRATPYVTAGRRGIHDVSPDSYDEGILADSETITTWIMPEDSPLSSMMESALLNNTRVWLRGQVAENNSPWYSEFAVPLVLERATLFADLR